MRLFAAILATTLFAAPLVAHDFIIGDITVGHPYSFAAMSSARTAGGYLTVTNNGDTPDTLISVEAPFESVTLHRTEVDGAGIARMIEQEAGFTIAPGETLLLEPGGGHVMFIGLNGVQFSEGARIDATLIFERAGRLPVTFNVEARGHQVEEMDHSAHGDALEDGTMDHSSHGTAGQ